VLGHSLQHGDFEHNLLWNIIYSFHLPAFFVISGYVSYKHTTEMVTLKKRALQLLLPFCSWSILTILLFYNAEFILILDCVKHPDSSYWFIYVLFLISAIFIISQKIAVKIKVSDTYLVVLGGGILVLLMAILNIRILGFQFVAFYFMFYVMGAMIKRYNLSISKNQCCFFGVVWLVMAVFWRQHEVPDPLTYFTFIPSMLLISIYRFICPFWGCLFFVGIASHYVKSDKPLLVKTLAYLGKISMGIYIIHLFVKDCLGQWYLQLYESNESAIFVVSDFTIKLITAVVLTELISRFKVLSLLLLGKNK
jgi:fucose 4-O-acetylase-like acetyltransferase